MAAPPIPLRCTRCGTSVSAPAPPGPSTVWFPCPNCGHPMPVVPWRERPPLFSWEVFPHLYPPLPPPRIPARHARPALLALLIAGTVALAGLAAVTAGAGAVALGGGTVTVAGVVVAGAVAGPARSTEIPIAGALVTFHEAGMATESALTNSTGAFDFALVPAGGITLQASAKGYSNESLDLFLSALYSTEGSPSRPAILALSPSNLSSNGTPTTTVSKTPFTDLEGFVASLWSASVLLTIGTIVSAAGCVALARDRRPAVALAGGAAAATAPGAVFVLEVAVAFPWLGAAAGITIGLGAVVAGVQAVRLASLDRPLEPE